MIPVYEDARDMRYMIRMAWTVALVLFNGRNNPPLKSGNLNPRRRQELNLLGDSLLGIRVK